MDELDELAVGVEEAGVSVVAVVDVVAVLDDVARPRCGRGNVLGRHGLLGCRRRRHRGRRGGRRGVVGGRGLSGQDSNGADAQGGDPGDHAGGSAATTPPLSRIRGELMAPFMPPESGSRLYATLGPGGSLSYRPVPMVWRQGKVGGSLVVGQIACRLTATRPPTSSSRRSAGARTPRNEPDGRLVGIAAGCQPTPPRPRPLHPTPSARLEGENERRPHCPSGAGRPARG